MFAEAAPKLSSAEVASTHFENSSPVLGNGLNADQIEESQVTETGVTSADRKEHFVEVVTMTCPMSKNEMLVVNGAEIATDDS